MLSVSLLLQEFWINQRLFKLPKSKKDKSKLWPSSWLMKLSLTVMVAWRVTKAHKSTNGSQLTYGTSHQQAHSETEAKSQKELTSIYSVGLVTISKHIFYMLLNVDLYVCMLTLGETKLWWGECITSTWRSVKNSPTVIVPSCSFWKWSVHT